MKLLNNVFRGKKTLLPSVLLISTLFIFPMMLFGSAKSVSAESTAPSNTVNKNEVERTEMPVTHIVLCWLKKAGDLNDRNSIIEATKTLREIPGIVSLRVGSVIKSNRTIVDDSFDIGITMQFNSLEAMQRYIKHPTHQSAVKNTIKPLTQKIVVYDFYEE